MMKKISAIFAKKDANGALSFGPYTEEMAAAMITRWAKRRLEHMRHLRRNKG